MEHILWEHNPCINQDITVIVPDEHAIHSDFPEAADWEDPERRAIQAFVELLQLSLDRILHALSGALGSLKPSTGYSRFMRACTHKGKAHW
jgi:hypothetical protein